MDKWIRELASVEIRELTNSYPVVEYTNSIGDRVEIDRDKISLYIDSRNKTIKLENIVSVGMNPMFKDEAEKPYLYIKTENEDIPILVDTHTGDFHDLPTVYDYIRRIVVVYGQKRSE